MEKFSFTICNNLGSLSEISAIVRSVLGKNMVSAEAIYAVMLAIEEMATNIIKYGYDDDAIHEIDIELCINSDAIVLTMIDDGHEFDPLSVEVSDISSSLDVRAIGGMGILLTRSMSDSMQYCRKNNKNFLQIKVDPRK